MQITIDTKDPVEKVVSVLSAAFGVSFGVVESGAGADGAVPAPAAARSRRPGRGSRRGPAAKSARPARASRRAAKSGGSVDTAAVRAWAREQGLQVSSRGPIPQPVLEAYRQSAA